MAHIGKQLHTLRNEAGLSQSELAKILGTSKSSINMYERNEREPGLVMLETIADYFNVDIEHLLGRQILRRLLSVHEGKVIVAYRDQPEIQPAVDTLLGVTDNPAVNRSPLGTAQKPIRLAAYDGSDDQPAFTTQEQIDAASDLEL